MVALWLLFSATLKVLGFLDSGNIFSVNQLRVCAARGACVSGVCVCSTGYLRELRVKVKFYICMAG